MPVTIHLDAQRLGVKVIGVTSGADLEADAQKVVRLPGGPRGPCAVADGEPADRSRVRGVRLFPWRAPATVDWSQTPVQLPTIPGQLQVMETKVTDIINKLDKMPLQQIGDELTTAIAELDQTLVAARGTLVSARGTLTNTASLTEPNSAQLQQMDSTLQEVSRAARSLRVLADYLERHPEALLRGKKGEAK